MRQEALQVALQPDDLYVKGGAYLYGGFAFFVKGLFQEAEENLTVAIEMIQKADAVGWLYANFIYLGILHSAMGRHREAQECYEAALDVFKRVRQTPSLERLVKILKLAAGVRERLNPSLDAAHTFDLQEIKMKYFQGMAAQHHGRDLSLYRRQPHE